MKSIQPNSVQTVGFCPHVIHVHSGPLRNSMYITNSQLPALDTFTYRSNSVVRTYSLTAMTTGLLRDSGVKEMWNGEQR